MSTTNFSKGIPSSTDGARQGSSSHTPAILPPLTERDFGQEGKLLTNVSLALEALKANRLRSVLTTLGIVIGVFSVVSMVTLVGGISANWTDTITGLGTNMIIIAPGTGNNLSNSGISSGGGVSVSSRVTSTLPASQTTLSLIPGDAQVLAKIPDVTEVSPVLSIREQVIVGNQNRNTRVAGVNANLQDI